MSVPPGVPKPLSALIEHGNKHFDFKKWAKVCCQKVSHAYLPPPPPPGSRRAVRMALSRWPECSNSP